MRVMRLKTKQYIWYVLTVLAASLFSPQLLAACAFANGAKTGSVTFMLPALTASLNPSDGTPHILSQVRVSAGDLALATGTNTTNSVWSGCSGNLIWNPLRTSIAGNSPGLSGYIETGIDNLYLYMYAGSQTNGNFGAFVTPSTAGGMWSRSLSTIHNGIPPWSIMGDMVLVLYQTGPVRKGGIIPAGPLAELKVSDGLQVLNISMNQIAVNVKGCTITTPNVNVKMEPLLKKQFTGPGSLSPKNNFSIGAQCDSGILPVMTFNSSGSGDDGSVFSLSNPNSEDSAKGLAVRLSYGDTVAQNGQPVALAATVNEGLNNFPFSAQYIQTQESVVAGKADATITFTLSYK